MGFVGDVVGGLFGLDKPSAQQPAPKYFIDPERAKQIAAARAKALKMQVFGAKRQMKIDLEG
jgi:hypothetical protein